jgi:hypothetical protein
MRNIGIHSTLTVLLPEKVNCSKYVIRILRNNDVVKEPYFASGKF